MNKVLIILLAFIVTGCSESSEVNEAQVNLLGVWNYSSTTQNFPCDGYEAVGILTISSLNGDVSKIGDITMQGESLELDGNRNCYLGYVDATITSASGQPSSQTLSEYGEFDEPLPSGTSSYSIPVYNENTIKEVTEYDNGVILTIVFTK